VDDLALVVAENLDFDVVRVLDEFLDVNAGIAKALFRLAAGGVVAFDEGNVIVRNAHPATAAAGNGLDHDGVANLFGNGEGVFFVIHRAFGSRRCLDAGLFCQRTADRFVAQGVHRARAGTNETDVAAFANFGEVGVFGKKAVARMNRVHICHFRGADNAVDAKVTLGRSGLADANGLVRHLDVHGVGVNLRIDRDGADVQFFAGADDADGNFSAIGDQDFFKHDGGRLKTVSGRTDFEQWLAELHGFAALDQNLGNHAFDFGFNFIHHLHRLDDADH